MEQTIENRQKLQSLVQKLQRRYTPRLRKENFDRKWKVNEKEKNNLLLELKIKSRSFKPRIKNLQRTQIFRKLTSRDQLYQQFNSESGSLILTKKEFYKSVREMSSQKCVKQSNTDLENNLLKQSLSNLMIQNRSTFYPNIPNKTIYNFLNNTPPKIKQADSQRLLQNERRAFYSNMKNKFLLNKSQLLDQIKRANIIDRLYKNI